LGDGISRDPIGERGGVSLYGLVGNSPLGDYDYLGLESLPTGPIWLALLDELLSSPNNQAFLEMLNQYLFGHGGTYVGGPGVVEWVKSQKGVRATAQRALTRIAKQAGTMCRDNEKDSGVLGGTYDSYIRPNSSLAYFVFNAGFLEVEARWKSCGCDLIAIDAEFHYRDEIVAKPKMFSNWPNDYYQKYHSPDDGLAVLEILGHMGQIGGGTVQPEPFIFETESWSESYFFSSGNSKAGNYQPSQSEWPFDSLLDLSDDGTRR
jgi:hypothetical protein